MQEVRIGERERATPGSARQVLARLFPHAGAYVVKGASLREIRFSAPVTCAADPLSIWQALFPRDGRYLVGTEEEFAKARRVAIPAGFEEWWLERLVVESRKHFDSIHALVRQAIERFVREHGGRLTDPGSMERFEALLFDLRHAIRWSLAVPVSPAIEARLRELGFTDREVLDFPGIAYRLGQIAERLDRPGVRFRWAQVLRLAAELPLNPADEAAINYARLRVGTYLTPVVLRDGQALTLAAADRERELLRTMAREAIAEEMHPLTFARELYKKLELGEGIVRDWERVARTEILEARHRGSFAADRGLRDAKTLVYRNVATNPCNGCLMLFRRSDGMPRLYAVREFEAEDAKGPNRGPWREWHLRIGPVHPQCRCGPVTRWTAAIAGVFKDRAAQLRKEMEERGLAA